MPCSPAMQNGVTCIFTKYTLNPLFTNRKQCYQELDAGMCLTRIDVVLFIRRTIRNDLCSCKTGYLAYHYVKITTKQLTLRIKFCSYGKNVEV